MALRDQPYFPLYVQDFLTDEKLIECSASATGIYIRLLCIMHKTKEYGVILLRQKDKQTTQQVENFACKLAKQMPHSQKEIDNALKELLEEDVIQIDGDKLLQKRMIRDNEISLIRANSGKKGGFATAKKIAKVTAKSPANTEYEYEYVNKDVIVIKDKVRKEIFNYWNNGAGIKHQVLDSKIKQQINITFKDYTVEQIKQGIDNYKFIRESPDHLDGKKWALIEFLKQANGLAVFLDIESVKDRYKKESQKTQGGGYGKSRSHAKKYREDRTI